MTKTNRRAFFSVIVASIVGSKKPPTKWIIVGDSGTTYLPLPTPTALHHIHTDIDWIQRQFSGAIYTNRECTTEADRLVDIVWQGTEYKPNYSLYVPQQQSVESPWTAL